MAFEGISVGISAETADFTAGVQAAKGRAEDLADSLGQLSRRASRADDTLEEAGDQATRTAGTFSVLTAGTNGLSVSFGTLSASITTITVGFTALLAVLTPAVAALAAFAGIAASITGVGLVGVLLAATQRTETLKRQVSLLSDTFIREFAPVTEEATRVLVALISQFRPLVSQLVPTEKEISTLGDGFQALGENVIKAIPPLVEAATSLATKFLPKVADASGGVEGFAKGILDLVQSDRFGNFISDITSAAKELRPELSQIADNLSGLLDEETVKGVTTLVDGFLDLVVVLTAIADKLDPILEGITTISSTFGGVGSSSLGGAGAADSGNAGDILPSLTSSTPQQYAPAPKSSARGGPIAAPPVGGVRVNVEGDTEVVRNISAEVTDERLREQRDRSQMNAGTGGP